MKRFITLSMILLAVPVLGQNALDSLLVGCYLFNGNAADSSGNSNHAVVNGATLVNGRNGDPNSAYSFDGTAKDVTISNFNTLIPNDELSISMWAKRESGGKCLFMLMPDSNDRCVGCAMYQGSTMIWDYGDLSNGGRMTYTVAGDASWHHYVFVVSDNDQFKAIYMDGNVLTSDTNYFLLMDKMRDLRIGADRDQVGGNVRWVGAIDEVLIYNRRLTSSEVSALYNGSHPCTPNVPTGINNEKRMDYKIYPSPASEMLFVQLDDNKRFQYEVYDLQGRQVKSGILESGQSEISVLELNNGNYVLRLIEGDTYQVSKFSVLH